MLELMPISLAVANGFVAEHHRHHKPVRGHKFSLGCMADGRLVGVAIVGRPVSRCLDDGLTLEVNRLCTDGTKNACSFLYGAAARAAKVMGYRKIITYILDTESGISLRASGWQCAGPSMERRRGRQRSWATGKSLPIFWTRRVGPVSVPPAGNARGWLADGNGPASAAHPNRCIRHK